MPKQCKTDNCINRVFGGGYCKFHQYRRTDRDKPLLESKRNAVRIKPYSVKRSEVNKEYSKLAKQFKKDNPFCEARLEGCEIYTSQVHHKKGRIGVLLTDLRHFLAVCEHCHHLIEKRPLMAKELGLSVSRLNK